MTFEDNIEKKSSIVKSIDIDLYVTTNQDFDKDTTYHAPYLDNIEDVHGHDFQFIIKDVLITYPLKKYTKYKPISISKEAQPEKIVTY